MGRRQGAEGIHRYTETQSVGHPAGLQIAPAFGLSAEQYAKVQVLGLKVSTSSAEPDMGTDVGNRFDYDVLVIGSGFGGTVSALRLTEKGYQVAVLEAGARFARRGLREQLVGPEAVPVRAGARAATASSGSTRCGTA